MLHFPRNADLDMPSSNHTPHSNSAFPPAGALSSAPAESQSLGCCPLVSQRYKNPQQGFDSALAARSFVMMMEHFRNEWVPPLFSARPSVTTNKAPCGFGGRILRRRTATCSTVAARGCLLLLNLCTDKYPQVSALELLTSILHKYLRIVATTEPQ